MDNTTAVWINALRNAQKAIRTAILGKGVQITGDLSSYPDAINQLKNPQGSKNISTNGTHDVADVAEVVVSVSSGGITPSGIENITQNGLYDITEKAFVNVNVPVGAEVVTGQISGSGSKTLTITNAIGKDNIAVFLICTSSTGVSGNMITSAGYINESIYMTSKSASNTMNISTQAAYNKNTGTISYTGSRAEYIFTKNAYFKYVYVAW